jgi:hypothetical protein
MRKIDRAAAAQAPGHRLVTIRFGDFLVERGVIDRQQLFVCLDFHVRKRCRLGEAVAYFGFIEPDEVERLASDYHELSEIVF